MAAMASLANSRSTAQTLKELGAGSVSVLHSDHGSPKARPVLFTGRCEQAGIEVSMGSIGDRYDDAVCESLDATLKKELIHRRPWPTRAEARSKVFAHIEGW